MKLSTRSIVALSAAAVLAAGAGTYAFVKRHYDRKRVQQKGDDVIAACQAAVDTPSAQ